MTPMEKLKPQLEDLKLYLGTKFEEINLNKASYKEEYIGYCGEKTQYINKGVRSDFIRLYRAQFNKEQTYTLGFSFIYIDTEDTKQKVIFSSSVGKEQKIFSPKKEMSIEECRSGLKNIIQQLKNTENVNFDDKIRIVQEEFLGRNYQLNPVGKKNKIK